VPLRQLVTWMSHDGAAPRWGTRRAIFVIARRMLRGGVGDYWPGFWTAAGRLFASCAFGCTRVAGGWGLSVEFAAPAAPGIGFFAAW
jgi:hypothetical protein